MCGLYAYGYEGCALRVGLLVRRDWNLSALCPAFQKHERVATVLSHLASGSIDSE